MNPELFEAVLFLALLAALYAAARYVWRTRTANIKKVQEQNAKSELLRSTGWCAEHGQFAQQQLVALPDGRVQCPVCYRNELRQKKEDAK